jgi:8-oxo-dGTP pyrophosphatase MutT (NUDIX family)
MGVRSRLAKVFGTSAPASVLAGQAASGMTPSTPFGPGAPIGPYDGFSRTPRSQNFTPGYNISARPRSHERVGFETLRGLIEAYDIASICIWHRIDSIRSLEWSLVASEAHEGDISDAVATGMAALKKPDRQTPFNTWLGSYLFDILAYDAGTLSRMRNRAGRTVGLRVIDGTTIAPLLDEWGNTPEADAPAYTQYANGLPWNSLRTKDLIYQPFRKTASSPYGHAPMESVLLNANTDLRFQAYFLQRFTEGNLPAAFASAPETWTPEQIEDFQEAWDAMLLGDQAVKSQVKWIPGGSKFAWSNEKDFNDVFSLHLMRKTASALSVVPSDMGFTESVNKSSGESQSDVQHRIGDVPIAKHVDDILSSFLQDDLGLPLKFQFDLGEEQDDRLATAQADDMYIKNGVIGSSEVRELRFGKTEPGGRPVPRFIFSSRSGPIPLSSLYAVAGPVDLDTAAPEPGAPLPHTAFDGVEGTQPSPPLPTIPLAEQEYGPSAIPPAVPVAKDGEAGCAPTAGITSATGITGYDLVGHHRDGDEEEEAGLIKAELTAYRSFCKARRRTGKWRDFQFRVVDPVRAHRLNDAGRLTVRKAAGDTAVAGLAVQAADTGRVLMLQRALDEDDPASGTWEMPGGHIEDGENTLQAAAREWCEETGLPLPDGQRTGTWVSPNGIYEGIVWTIPREDAVPLDSDRDQITNPDDPDGDTVEAIAWWDPAQLPGNPAVRQELLDNIDAVMAALSCTPVVKARAEDWPGWSHDLDASAHWAPLIAGAFTGALTTTRAEHLARDYAGQPAPSDDQGDDAATAAALTWLTAQGLDLAAPLAEVLTGVYTDGYLIGAVSAQATVDGQSPDFGDWTPGDTAKAKDLIGQRGTDGLTKLLGTVPTASRAMAATKLKGLAKVLHGGVKRGDPPAVIGTALLAVLNGLSGALAIAITEITRASGAGALFAYQENQVGQTRWILDPSIGTCAACIANAAASPMPTGAQYPSGDTSPPVHTRCRCALGPA